MHFQTLNFISRLYVIFDTYNETKFPISLQVIVASRIDFVDYNMKLGSAYSLLNKICQLWYGKHIWVVWQTHMGEAVAYETLNGGSNQWTSGYESYYVYNVHNQALYYLFLYKIIHLRILSKSR